MRTDRHGLRPVSVFLTALLFFHPLALSAQAQAPQQEPAEEAGGSGGLQIRILEGEGAINNVRQRTARDPIVEIRDENNRPVAGAVVVFTLPGRGPSGAFANGSQMTTVTTNANGQAVGSGLTPNSVEGQFNIQVSASHQGKTASTVITQTNAMAAAAGIAAGKLITILAIVGGAAAGGIIAVSGDDNGNGGAAPPSVSISSGSPSVGAPR